MHTRNVCRARVYTFSTRAISHPADIPHAIIVLGRFRRNDDHWVALTVNVNITDLDRGEWIVKSITRAVTTRGIPAPRAASASSFRILFDLPSNKFPSTYNTHIATKKKGLRLNGTIRRGYAALERNGKFQRI